MCFFLGVSLNVIGATTSLMATSSLPSPTELQEALSAYQGAIVEVESISEAMGAVTLASGPMVCLRVFKLTCAQLNGQAIHQLVNDQLRAWKRAHHLHITNLLITGNLIAQWNIQRFVYALVMLTGVASFFLGLIFFIIDTQPVAVWVTILLTSPISYSMIQGVKAVSSRRFLQFGPDSRSLFQQIFSTPDYFAEEKQYRAGMVRRQQSMAFMYKLCSDQRFI